MASKTIATILNLKDNMSGGLVKVSQKVNGLSKETQRASKQMTNMSNNFIRSASQMAAKGAKLALATAGLAAGAAIKTGLSEAFDLEGYRIQLETATKDTKKAGEIMKYAVDLANKTPFEAAPLVEGASKLEMMGLSAQKYLPMLGDMAAATNKPVDQAVEAMIDAQTGELERLKEFGITKLEITKKGNEMFRNQQIVNNQGQIVDQERFNKALEAIMKDRFAGGMERQSNTVKGLWSTVTGVSKSALAQITGMMNDGTIKQGSMLDKLKEKVKLLADQFDKWQKDGTIDRAAQAFTDGFTKMYDGMSKVVTFIINNRKTIESFLTFLLGFTVFISVLNGIRDAIFTLNFFWLILNGTIMVSPLGKAYLAFLALSAVIAVVIANWKDICTWIEKAWEWLNKWNEANKENKTGSMTASEYNQKLTGLKIPIHQGDTRMGGSANALGTNYFSGGRTLVGEHGPEIVDLPGGSKVKTASKTKNMLGGNPIYVSVNVQGNVIGNEEYADYIGNHIAYKINNALLNT